MMAPRSDAWFRSILPNIGALSDQSSTGWVYIGRFYNPEDERERGVWKDLPTGSAVTRAEALVIGQEIAYQDPDFALMGWEVVEEWVYTPEEARGATFQQVLEGTMKSIVDEDCGCGETK